MAFKIIGWNRIESRNYRFSYFLAQISSDIFFLLRTLFCHVLVFPPPKWLSEGIIRYLTFYEKVIWINPQKLKYLMLVVFNESFMKKGVNSSGVNCIHHYSPFKFSVSSAIYCTYETRKKDFWPEQLKMSNRLCVQSPLFGGVGCLSTQW